MKMAVPEAVKIESLEIAGFGTATCGLEVLHPIFGPGRIVAIFSLPPGSATLHTIGIEFESVGYKALAPEYAKLQRK
jgi:hypothetical protein